MNDERRPSPEALLKAARREGRGRLKILLGAAPGVGKTVEMLREGADLQARGLDVVAGVVETHGRADTEALLAPLERLPKRTIEHGAHRLEEFDIDALLARRPQVALIDELAHTNAPGSRHAKRWQDVEELRDAGIDVLSTLNIQHVESLNDVVASFTHVRVRETVPDQLFDEAEVEIVDLPPDELIERLKAGKVYIPEEAGRALSNFFSRSNLSALRELALRRAARTVDRQMLDDLRASGSRGIYAGSERIVVAIGDQPGGEQLIRAAKRLADGLDASWSALVIETPRSARLDPAARARLSEALRLAATLGAAVSVVPATDVAGGISDFLVETRATALVIGKTQRGWWFALRHPSVVDQLVRGLTGVSVHVIPSPIESARPARGTSPLVAVKGRGSIKHALAALALVAVTTALARLVEPLVGPNAIDLLYLVPVVIVAGWFGLGPAMVAVVASALAYNFFFLPPLYTLTIQDPLNLVTFFVFAGVGVTVGQLAGTLQRRALLGARSAIENAAIAAFGQRLAAVSGATETATVVCDEIARLLKLDVQFLARGTDGAVAVSATSRDLPSLGAIDMASADWAFERNEPAGHGTGTLTASDWQFHPLATATGVLGVLAIAAVDAGDPLPADRALLFATLKGQASLAYERIRLEADTRELDALRQRDELRTTLLSSLAHDLRTPLTSVIGAAREVARASGPSEALNALTQQSRRLGRFFDNLLEMTRLQEGATKARIEPTDLTDAVAAAIHDLTPEIGERRIDLDVPATLPLVCADPTMLHHILLNLLGNAAKFAPADGRLSIAARCRDGTVELDVSDDGPGLPPGDPARLFDRFTRFAGSDRSGGSGLGLAIVKGFADAMGLTVTAAPVHPTGASFRLTWPADRLHPEPA